MKLFRPKKSWADANMQCPKSQLPRPARATDWCSRWTFFSRIPVSAPVSAKQRKKKQNSRRNHQRQPNMFSTAGSKANDGQQMDAKQGKARRKESGANRTIATRHPALRIGECTEWIAGERRKAQSLRARNLGCGYLHRLHLLGAALFRTTWQWLASFACSTGAIPERR